MEKLGSHLAHFNDVWYFNTLRKRVQEVKFYSNLTIITGTLHEDQLPFLIIARSVLLRMRNVWDKFVDNIKIHLMFSNFFLNRSVYKLTSKNILEQYWPQVTIWHKRISCWIPTATNTHSQYVILIAFPLQQWLHEHASLLRYTYIDCRVFVLCCVGSFLCDGLITRPEESCTHMR